MRAPSAALLALAFASACAADIPAPPPDSIAAAKKDFAQLKAGTMVPDAGSSMPSLDMKDIGPSPGATVAAPTPLPTDKEASLDPTKKKAGTGNWLVDAMDKEKRGDRSKGSALGDEALKDDDLLLEADRTDSRAGKEAKAADEAREKPDSRELAQQAYNPLNSFMGSWVSARDHDLLVPSAKSETLIEGESARTRVDSLPGLDLGNAGSPADNALPSPDSGGFADSRSGANPYLALLDIEPIAAPKPFSPAEIPGFEPLGSPDGPRGPQESGVDLGPLDASRSFIPDFAQPADDDKYFKQMKRF